MPDRERSVDRWNENGNGDDDGNGRGNGNGEGTGNEDEVGSGPRDVVVPLRVYKAVTVFSTLFAVVVIVGGFALIDRATGRATLAIGEVDPLLALVGIGLIATGAVVYAFSTRFRTEEMGNPKDDADEPSDNG